MKAKIMIVMLAMSAAELPAAVAETQAEAVAAGCKINTTYFPVEVGHFTKYEIKIELAPEYGNGEVVVKNRKNKPVSVDRRTFIVKSEILESLGPKDDDKIIAVREGSSIYSGDTFIKKLDETFILIDRVKGRVYCNETIVDEAFIAKYLAGVPDAANNTNYLSLPFEVGQDYVIPFDKKLPKMRCQGMDNIKVGAGEYKCYHLSLRDKGESVDFWHCPGVGTVKLEYYIENPYSKATMELIDFGNKP